MDIALNVPSLSIVFMIITLVICFCYPIGMAVYLRVKKKANISPFFIGCGIFILFVLILENLFHNVVLNMLGPVSTLIKTNVWLYALYGGLAAGLFEETGRWLSFKILLKKKQKPSNALMYGAGHGGIEAIILVGIAYIVNIVVSIMINNGNATTLLADTKSANVIMQMFSLLNSTPSYLFLMGGIERLIAITLHICLSVFVYKAVTEANRKIYFIYAVLIHAGVDFITMMGTSDFNNIYLTELILAIFVVVLVIITKRIYEQLSSNILNTDIIEEVSNDKIIFQNSDNDDVEILESERKGLERDKDDSFEVNREEHIGIEREENIDINREESINIDNED